MKTKKVLPLISLLFVAIMLFSVGMIANVSGVPFLDGTSTPECDNLIIYGHNMKNGTMFSDITQYRDKAYCEEHPYIELETADGLKVYQVFALHRQIYVDC